MENNKYDIDDLLNAIVDEKPIDVQAIVNDMMVDRAQDEIAALQAGEEEFEMEDDDGEEEYFDANDMLDDVNDDSTDTQNTE